MREEAEAYRSQVVSKSEGEAEQFTKLLTEYRKAPEVTRERLYLDAVEVMTQSTKIYWILRVVIICFICRLTKLFLKRISSAKCYPYR